jgi:uncharacterized protein YndB with AHSA1/START domain
MSAATAHTSFTINRRFRASPERLFQAWSEPAAKRRWSDCHAEAGLTEHEMDFRPGGHELTRQVLPDGRPQAVRTVYLDIVDAARIVFAYTIEVDARRLSASLVTIDIAADGAGASLRFTEQLAYFDGHDDRDERRRGTEEGLDRLALLVARL